MEWIPIVVIAVLALIVVISNIHIVQQSRAYVIERLGAFSKVWQVGMHVKVPFIERVAKKVSLKEQVLDYPPQPVITKDNVTMQIDTVVYYQITDPKLYTYGVERPMMAMETLTATTLRNIIGDLELDQTLTSRDVINTKMRAILDEATDPWGIKVNRVELKNILPPQDIQNSMEKQMKAERDRRQAILQAEGTKRSQILVAEGEKEAAILKADAEKQAAILKAEAEKQAAILKADGEAQAIMAVQKAMADSLALLNEKAPNDQVLKLKALEAMQKVADGKATKIIIPSELQGFAGLASGIAETVKATNVIWRRRTSALSKCWTRAAPSDCAAATIWVDTADRRQLSLGRFRLRRRPDSAARRRRPPRRDPDPIRRGMTPLLLRS